VGRHVARLTLRATPARAAALRPALADVLAAARVLEHELVVSEDVGDGGLVVGSIELAPPPAEP
jgi:hypothetical protein